MGLLRRKRTSKEIIIHTVTLQLSLSGEYMHLIQFAWNIAILQTSWISR